MAVSHWLWHLQLQDAALHDGKSPKCLPVHCSVGKDANHVHAVCQMLVEDHNGVVPQTFDNLEKLPGVGHKTASVVICTAFGYAAARHTSCNCNVYEGCQWGREWAGWEFWMASWRWCLMFCGCHGSEPSLHAIGKR